VSEDTPDVSLAHRLRFISGHKGRIAVLLLNSSTEPHLSFAVAFIVPSALLFIHPCNVYPSPLLWREWFACFTRFEPDKGS
jgi:hypothetical protein